MKKQIILRAALMTGLLLPFAASALSIDEFTTNQGPHVVTATGVNTASSSTSGVGIIGSERDLHVSIPAVPGSTGSATATVGLDRFELANNSQSTSLVTMQWDGGDSSSTINTNGLGGLDLTEGNATDAFEIRFLFDDLPSTLEMTVWSAGGSSTIIWPGPALLLTTELSIFIPFSAFVTDSGSGADFTSVGAIQLVVGSPTNGLDLEIDYIRTTLAPVPVPAAVWLFASALMGLGLRRHNA